MNGFEWTIGALQWATGIAAVIGVILNNRRMRVCFKIWIVTNAIRCAIHSMAGDWGFAATDAVFLILSIEGLIKWKSVIDWEAALRRRLADKCPGDQDGIVNDKSDCALHKLDRWPNTSDPCGACWDRWVKKQTKGGK